MDELPLHSKASPTKGQLGVVSIKVIKITPFPATILMLVKFSILANVVKFDDSSFWFGSTKY